VNLGRTEDNWCFGVAAIVERRLLASPQVAVLDRTYLEQVSVERAVSPDAPIQKLLAAMARIELEYEKKDKGQVEIRARLKALIN